jgi:hypothetical protein
MNGLEDSSAYHELMFRVPDALTWAVIDELDEGFEISVPHRVLRDAVLPSSTWALADPSRSPSSAPSDNAASQPDLGRFVSIGVLTPERLRLGVLRLVSSLIESNSELRFVLLGSLPQEVPSSVVNSIVQAAMLGRLLADEEL